MSDVNLGTVKATLEFDTADAQKGAEAISRALKLTQEQIVALANATEDQRVKMIAAFEAEASGAEGTAKSVNQAAQSIEKWTEANQRAAQSMNATHGEALKMDAEFEKHSGVLGNLVGQYEEYSQKIAKTGVAMGIAAGAAIAFGAAVLALGKQIFDAAAANAEYVEHLDKLSAKTGLSTDMLEGLGKAATESGVSLESVTRAVVRMQQAIANDSKAIGELGLDLRALKAASPEEQLKQVVGALGGMNDVAERNALSIKILGKSFAEARLAMEEYLTSGDRYVNLTDDQKQASREMDAELDKAKTAWADLAKQFGAVATSPELIATINEIGGAVRDLAKFIQENREAIGWFFGLLTSAVNPASIGAKAGLQLRSLGQAAAEAIGARPEDASPEAKAQALLVKTVKQSQIFQPEDPLKTIKGPTAEHTAYLDELGKQAAAKAEAASKVAEAEAKKLQGVMDGLSGAKAQEEVDGIAKAVGRLGVDGVNDLAGLGKQLVDLASKGAKIPESLTPAIQAFAQKAAMQGVPQLAAKAWDEMTKTAMGNIKKQSDYKIKAEKDAQAVAKANQDAVAAINRSQTDMLQQQLRDGTLSVKKEYDLRRDLIAAHGREEIDQLLKRRALATDPAIIAAIDEEIRKWNELTGKEIEATREMERFAQMGKLASDVGDILGGISDVFDAIGISADSAIGKILGGLQQAAAAVQDFSQQTTTVGKISSGLSAAAGIYKTGQQKGALAGAGSGALTGAAIGTMIAPGIGTAVGAIAGAVIGLAGALRKPEFKKIMNDVGKSWGVNISEGLAKEIEGIAKANKISRSLAELLDVSKIIGESGKDPREFTAKISDLMNAIKSGAVPAAQGLAELGRAFNQVADAALKSGNIGDKALVGLLKRARELGQVTPEMKEFVGGQLQSAVDGVQKLLDVLPADTAAKAGSSGALLAATFNALAAEQGIVAASAALGPAYDQLMQQISKAGLAIPEALQSIGRQMELGKNKEFQAASGAAAATSQVLSGLGNAGYMDTSVLGASADVAKQAFDQAKNAGATDKEAYQAIGSLLSDIKNASIQSGQEISGLAQELITGAQAEGVVIQGDQLSVLVDIRNILAGGGYTPSGTGPSGPGGDAGGSGSETGGVTGNGSDVFVAPPSVPYRERELRHFAGGSGGVQDFGAGTRAILHGREAVITEKDLATIVAGTNAPTREGGGGFSFSAEVGGITGRGGSGLPDFGSNTRTPIHTREPQTSKQMPMAGASVSFHPVFNNDPIQTNESRAELSAFQIDEFVTAVINKPLFKQILRDQGLRG